jgi:hypothetical protein
MLNVIMLSVIILNVIMLSVLILNVVMLSVVLLSVGEHYKMLAIVRNLVLKKYISALNL